MSEKVTFLFYLNKYKKEKNGQKPIYMRLFLHRKKKELDTGYYANESDWIPQAGRTKKNPLVNEALNNLESRYYSKILEFQKIGEKVDLEKLKASITNSKLARIPSLLEYVDNYSLKTKIRNDIVQATKSRFERTKGVVSSYLDYIGKRNLQISEVDFKLIDGFDSYLRAKYTLAPNTLAKYHSRFRTICLKARNEGYLTINPYSSFQIRTAPTQRGYLSKTQIETLEGLKFENQSLEKVRDVFLFSIYSSLRFSDVITLTKDNLFEDSEGKANLSFVIEKSGEQISLPLLDKAVQIIQKYSNSEYSKIKKRLLPTISNQKTNEYLKVIADLASIEMKLTYHVARHTFATTIWLGNGGSIQELQKILGHANIRETMIYGKISPELLKSSFAKINERIKS